MLEFIKANLDSIISVILLIVCAFVAIKLRYTKQVKQILLALVIKAETMYGGKTGQLKFSAVCDWIYEKLPAIVRLFVTSKDIAELIEDAVDEMKKYLASNDNVSMLVGVKGE